MKPTSPLLGSNERRWEQLNSEQDAELAARAQALTVSQRLERGLQLSRTAAELRRAAWEAQHGHPAV